MRPIATDVALSVVVCVLGTPVSPPKTSEPIEMPLGSRAGCAQLYNRVLDWGTRWRHLANTTE